jgi:hypothetical protein
VPQEVLVVALRVVVRSRVGAAAFLAREPGDDDALRELEQEPKLERLRDVDAGLGVMYVIPEVLTR